MLDIFKVYNEAQILTYGQNIESGKFAHDLAKIIQYAIKKPDGFITHEVERDVILDEKSATGRISDLQDLGLLKKIGKRKLSKNSTCSVWQYVHNPHERRKLIQKRYFAKWEKWKRRGWKWFKPFLAEIVEKDFKPLPPEEGDQLNLF